MYLFNFGGVYCRMRATFRRTQRSLPTAQSDAHDRAQRLLSSEKSQVTQSHGSAVPLLQVAHIKRISLLFAAAVSSLRNRGAHHERVLKVKRLDVVAALFRILPRPLDVIKGIACRGGASCCGIFTILSFIIHPTLNVLESVSLHVRPIPLGAV